VIGRLKVALAFFSVVAINQIFPQQRRQIILICAAKLTIFLKKKKKFPFLSLAEQTTSIMHFQKEHKILKKIPY